MFQSCESTKNQIMWVSGYEILCSSDSDSTNCLRIHLGEDIKNPKWEVIQSNIKDFKFEEGYLRKIEVKSEKVSDDPTLINYTFIKELDKQIDPAAVVKGSWTLNSLNNNEIDKNLEPPTLNIDLSSMLCSGIGDCNNYSGEINLSEVDKIEFSNILSTLKACLNGSMEQEYFDALREVASFQMEDRYLIFSDASGKRILSFTKDSESTNKNLLSDKWILNSISNNVLDNTSPSPILEINVSEMKIYGNNGCNQFNAEIKDISENQIDIGNMVSTKMICPDMEIPDNFDNALSQSHSYKLEGQKLTFYDQNDNEILQFTRNE